MFDGEFPWDALRGRCLFWVVITLCVAIILICFLFLISRGEASVSAVCPVYDVIDLSNLIG